MRPRWTTRALAAGRIHLCEGCHGAFVPTWISPFFCRSCERETSLRLAIQAGRVKGLQHLCKTNSKPVLRRTFFSQLP